MWKIPTNRGMMTQMCSLSNTTTCQSPKCTGLRAQVGSKRMCIYRLSEMNALKTERRDHSGFCKSRWEGGQGPWDRTTPSSGLVGLREMSKPSRSNLILCGCWLPFLTDWKEGAAPPRLPGPESGRTEFPVLLVTSSAERPPPHPQESHSNSSAPSCTSVSPPPQAVCMRTTPPQKFPLSSCPGLLHTLL